MEPLGGHLIPSPPPQSACSASPQLSFCHQRSQCSRGGQGQCVGVGYISTHTCRLVSPDVERLISHPSPHSTPWPGCRQCGCQEVERRAGPGPSVLHPPTPGAPNHAGLSQCPQGHLQGCNPLWEQHAALSWHGATERASRGCQEQLYEHGHIHVSGLGLQRGRTTL